MKQETHLRARAITCPI